MTLLPLRAEDLPEILVIEQIASPEPWTLSGFEEALRRGYYGYVIENQGIQAFCIATDGMDESQLLNIAVTPMSRRKGYARLLLQTLIARARDKFFVRFLLEVRVSNVAAIRLYESFGFRYDGFRKNYYRTPLGEEDAALYSLIL